MRAGTDGDGLSDGAEVLKYGTNPLNPDTDGDLLIDGHNVTGWSEVSWSYVKKYSDVYAKLNRTWEGAMIGERSMGTDPRIRDTDGDGVPDGYEVQNLSRMGVSEYIWGAILHARDYDGDGIPDGYELRMAYWVYVHNKTAWRAGRYLNPANRSDAELDFDNDTLSNIEEYRRDPQGDFDGGGTPDIYDNDDDNDSILTSVEVQYHLNPYDPLDALGDLDHDGLSNLFEYLHGLNMQAADTDHDGIVDGAELSYWENRLAEIHTDWTSEQILNMSVNYTCNPDVDGDNITDGKEINGYCVKIITGWQKDGMLISEMRYILPAN